MFLSRLTIVFLAILLLTTAAITSYPVLIDDRIYPGITIAGWSVGGQTRQQSRQIIAEAINRSTRVLKLKINERTVVVSPSDLGIEFDIQQAVSQAFAIGRLEPTCADQSSRQFKFTCWIVSDRQVEIPIDFTTKQLSETIQRIDPEFETSPVQPSLAIDHQEVIINWGKSGRMIDQTQLAQDLIKRIQTRSKQSLELKTIATPPSIPRSSLLRAADEARSYLNRPLILQVDDRQFEITREEIAHWLTFETTANDIKLTLQDKALDQTIDRIAKAIEIKKIDRKITQDGELLEEGRPGRTINREQLKTALKDRFKARTVESIQIATSIVPVKEVRVERPFTPGLYEGRYLEINLAEQKLYLINGQTVESTYGISSGKRSTPTPKGTFSINNKVSLAYSISYDLYMPNWMAFIGSKYGIHGLPFWRDGQVEGASHIGTPVSHGCVRLTQAAAQAVYEQVNLGTPVYIH